MSVCLSIRMSQPLFSGIILTALLKLGIPLHRFPNPEILADYFNIWKSNIGDTLDGLDSLTIYNNRRVCHRHFEDNYKYPKNKLSRLATPVLYMPEHGSKIVKIEEPFPRRVKVPPSTSDVDTLEFVDDDMADDMALKLYAVSDGPPSLSVRQALEYLKIPFKLINVDYGKGEHLTDEYALMNPQKEIPVLDDDGFYLSESNAILLYICDKYRPEDVLYPQDPKVRAIVHQRLCFNLSTYYANISSYTMAPIFFDYKRTPLGLKKVHMALEVFETYLTRLGTKYAAADHLTIADFQLINSTMTLEAIDFNFSKYSKIQQWYNDFKNEYPELWKISEDAMEEIRFFIANPPDLTHLCHPIHPARNVN